MAVPEKIFDVLEMGGEIPLPRFGHSITAINKLKVVLFGGATGDTGKYAMTGDTYLFNITKRCWSKLATQGILPSPRAAHAATTVELMQMVVYGGATGGTRSLDQYEIGGALASDDLYLLDLRQGEDQAQWIIVPVVGPTPGRRYGHSITFCNPYLFVFGGNTGSDPVNDVWCLSVERAPFSWARIVCSSELPPARVYHSAAQCMAGSAAGMMIVFGGRSGDQAALNDTWGLRKHRNGSWDWVKAPYKPGGVAPVGRYQHSALFINSVMLAIGGRCNNVTKVVPFEAYDTETSEWLNFAPIKRFRHASWCFDNIIYVHGGFQQDSPNVPTELIVKIDTSKLYRLLEAISVKGRGKEETKAPLLGNATTIESIQAHATGSAASSAVMKTGTRTNMTMSPLPSVTMKTVKKAVQQKRAPEFERNFRLSSQAHVAMSFNVDDPESELSNFVRKVPVDELQEESKKICGHSKVPVVEPRRSPNDPLYSMFINHLLKPKEYSTEPPASTFVFKKEYVLELAKQFQACLESQPTMINLRTPVKVFGNLYGNFQDLMRIFDLWKYPTEGELEGDIDSFAYLFLGNYVDRGNRSLETICLLMALKLKYPDSVHLLRGSHEDRLINAVYGFGEECATRLHENINELNSVFQAINNAFAWLPLAALVEGKILCVHGGIGPAVGKLEDLNKVGRPIELGQESATDEQAILLNVLWSDPADTELELGFKKNLFRSHISSDHIVKYGADMVAQFLKTNGLEMIIRGHEVVTDGFDTFAESKLITVTSCTDYCGRCNNSACILVVQKTFDIVPKLLLPISDLPKPSLWLDNDETFKKRPLTPPRQRRVPVSPTK